jgi:hypothetical protein
MIKKIVKMLVPPGALALRATLRNYRILSQEFGQYRSMKRRDCVDRENRPIPWYTYPAIEFIKQLDFSDRMVFEYGSGNSTLFWAARCRKLVSVEDDQHWYSKVRAKLPGNVDYTLIQGKQEYVHSIDKYHAGLDVVIIDGRHREDCAIRALQKLKDDGLLILDNSDWEQEASEVLRQSNLIEVDMSGFGPINGYTWTTSFYFSRNVKLIPAHGRQPAGGIGSLQNRRLQAP